MKVSKSVSTLACLALLSTYSVNGFAKTGNGDSYSGPTLSGSAVALTLDKGILNSQLTKALSSCLTSGGDKSYLSKVLTPFYGKELKYKSEERVHHTFMNKDGKRKDLKTNDYFNSKAVVASQGDITDFNKDDLTIAFKYEGPSASLIYKSGWKKIEYTMTSELEVYLNLSKTGVLKLKTYATVNSNNTPMDGEAREKIIAKLRATEESFENDRLLIVKDLPIFTANVQDIDIFDQINGDFIREDRMLNDLKMVYDRNEKAPYSQILNASHEYKVAPTQFMAPNAELADCVSDELGRL